MKAKDIKPKHLVLGRDFNDFALATDKVDFSKEDLCSYITGLTNNFYWLNTESVWGPIGFNWEDYNASSKKGRGAFSKSNINVSIIPKIPDSYRHESLIGIFKNIDNNITFLDSDWSHLDIIHHLDANQSQYTTKTIECHFDSLKDTGIQINNATNAISEYYTRYRIVGNVDGCSSKGVVLLLTKENKHTLNLDYSNNRCSRTDKPIYIESIPEEDTVFNIEDYIKLPFGQTTVQEFKCNLITSEIFDNIKVIHYTTALYLNNKSIRTISFNIDRNYNKNPFDEVIIDLHLDEIKDEYKYEVNIRNTYTKKLTYLNLDFDKISNLNYFYNKVVFDEVPDIKDIPTDKVTTIFKDCVFKSGYKYGKLKADKKIFDNLILWFKITTKDVWELKSTGQVVKAFLIYDFTEQVDLEFDNLTYNTPNLPSIHNNNSYRAYLLNIDYKEGAAYSPNYSSEPKLASKTGSIRTSKCSSAVVMNHKDSVIFVNNRTLSFTYAYNSYGCLLFVDDIEPEYFKFETNRDNIIDYKYETIDNTPLYLGFYIYKGYEIKYILRNTTSVVNITTSNIVKSRNTEVLIYNQSLRFIANNLDEDIVQYMLDSIVTIGDVEDSSDKTITILSKYYQNLKEETKNRLIGDGYTIVEQL